MPPNKKKKIIVREIKPKIKIVEVEKKEQSVEKPLDVGEPQLEEIVSDAPSSREFPAFSSRPIIERPSEREVEVPNRTNPNQTDSS